MLQFINEYSPEFKHVANYFNGAPISAIYSFQNIFQTGRYILRREMLQTDYEVSYCS